MSVENVLAVVASSLIGFVFIGRSLYHRAKVQASQNWPPVMGTIVEATLRKQSDGEGTTYAPQIRYDYVVNGVRYTSNRIAFTPQTYVRSKRAQQDLDRYPVNSAVTVYFDPAKPSDAVLQRNAPNTVLGLAAGIVLLAIAVAGALRL